MTLPAEAASAPIRRQFFDLVADVLQTTRSRFAAVAVLGLAAAIAEGAGLLLLLPLLDMLGLSGAGNVDRFGLREFGPAIGLEGALALYVFLIAIGSAVIWCRAIAGSHLILSYMDDLRFRLHKAVMAMGWAAITTRRQADLTHAMIAEVGRCSFAVDILLRLLAQILQMGALFLAALSLSPGFSLATIALAVIAALAVRTLGHRSHALGQATSNSVRTLHAELADQMAGLRVLKTMGGAIDRRALVFRKMAQSSRDRQHAITQSSATIRAVQRTLAAGFAALTLGAGIGHFAIPLSEMLVLLLLFARLMHAGFSLQDNWRQILHQLPTHAHLMQQLLEWRAAAEPLATEPAPILRQQITLSNVSYRHKTRAEAAAALTDISVTLPAFATTALIGPSGAGKTTLADLLLGLVAPDTGTIAIDGTILDGPGAVAWRTRTGLVPQDPFLFHQSIRDNLLLADPAATEAELWQALDLAAASDLVRRLPAGLDTLVGDRGSTLSGGERQRIALARTLLRRPDLLVLDEATSSLDCETEWLVAQSLRQLHGEMSVLVVAHRPSTVRDADHVIFLEQGRLVAAGSWADIQKIAGARLNELGLGNIDAAGGDEDAR